MTILGIVIGALFLVSILLPSRRHGDSSPRLKSATNLREIGLAIMQYSNDNAGGFPDSFQTILRDEDVTSQVFISPFSSDTRVAGPTTQATVNQLVAGGHCSYVYLGKGLTIKTATPNTVVAYEPSAPSSGGSNVLFGDFHVDWLNNPIVAKLVAKIATTKSPVTMPSN